MTTRLRNERGQVIVLAAVMIPVFLLMTALVLDAGSWFAHKRQLQNRADAAALAAGDELAKRWPACITDPASQTAITAVAKHYGGATRERWGIGRSKRSQHRGRRQLEVRYRDQLDELQRRN